MKNLWNAGNYVPNEVEKFSTFYSTVDRKRGTTRVWFVGNTITRANPYIYEWGLQQHLRNMKQGEIKELYLKNIDGEDIKVAIEYCKSSGGKSMSVGHNKSMIDKGAWQTSPQPHLPKSIKKYKKLMRVGFQYQGFRFIGELLSDKKELNWYIYPYNDNFDKDNILIFSDKIKSNPLWQRNPYDITINPEKVNKIMSTFREGNIFYSDDLTGTDFKNVIDFSIRR